jgi:hypothetical protein
MRNPGVIDKNIHGQAVPLDPCKKFQPLFQAFQVLRKNINIHAEPDPEIFRFLVQSLGIARDKDQIRTLPRKFTRKGFSDPGRGACNKRRGVFKGMHHGLMKIMAPWFSTRVFIENQDSHDFFLF